MNIKVGPKAEKKLFNEAYRNLGYKSSISVEEYAKRKELCYDEASEFDINDDRKITVEEEMCGLFAQKLTGEKMVPTMVLCNLYNSLNLGNSDFSNYKREIDISA